MAGTPLTFPNLVKRLVKGAELTFAEGDANLTAIQSFCEALANLLAASLNPDGTLIANSVGAAALQAASVQLSNLNPALLYNIVPVDTDTGTIQGSYVITARGGLAGSNLIPGGAVYDANGNYTINGLTPNLGYYWTKGVSDVSCNVPDAASLTVAGAFSALTPNVVLTGTPNATITATLNQSAPITAYADGMMFFVYTGTANNGASTLNVNNIGAIPIHFNGQGLTTGAIQGPGVFAVIYKAGVFVLFSGAGGSSGAGSSTTITTSGYSGMSLFNIPAYALATSFPSSATVAHGLGASPTEFNPVVYCVTPNAGFSAGQQVNLSEFVTAAGAEAFISSFDGSNIYITQNAAPYIVAPTTAGGATAGALTALNPVCWQIQGVAALSTNFSGVAAFPALTYAASNPTGAFSYQNFLYTFANPSTSGKFLLLQTNLLSNEISIVESLASSATKYTNVNGAIFSASFGFSATPAFLFCDVAGVHFIPAINPGLNIIPGSTAYDNTGSAGIGTLKASTTYTWTPGANDVSLAAGATTYLAANAVDGKVTVTIGLTAVTGTLSGAPGTIVTGTLITGSGGWSSTQFSTQIPTALAVNSLDLGCLKPVWYNDSDPLTGTATVYACPSTSAYGSVSAISCAQITSSAAKINGSILGWAGGAGVLNTSNVDLTDNANKGIVNASAFQKFYPKGSTAKLACFQYNPITNRIYVITGDFALVHIFQISTALVGSNDFSAWFNMAGSTREQALTYVKSVAIGGGTGGLGAGAGHHTVEFDLTTGKEKCIVVTNSGSVTIAGASFNVAGGTVTRIPWNE